MKKILLLLLFFGLSIPVSAETWDEPWQKEIIYNADFFLLAKVIAIDDDSSITIELLKQFGKQNLKKTLHIKGYSMLNLKSSSGSGLHLGVDTGKTYYFLLTKGKNNSYQLPTPTSGFALLDDDGNVTATYRHSIHQALIPKDIYEMTYTAVWNNKLNAEYDYGQVKEFIEKYMKIEPAGFDEDDVKSFFLQHAALETAYLLGLEMPFSRVVNFLESDIAHSRISALRLLGNNKDSTSKDYLIKFIQNGDNDNFEIVIAIWALKDIGDKKYLKIIRDFASKLSDEDTSFGVNLMDPRISTYFPSPRVAANAII